MTYAVTFGKIVGSAFTDPLAWLGGFFIAVMTYLVGPGPAFYALWIAVSCDLFSRLVCESVNHGGFFSAIKGGHIQSDKMFQGAKIKIPAYFIMCVFAAQVERIFPYEYTFVASSVIYGIFFFVELESTCENFIEAGVQEFAWLKRFSQRKLEKLIEDGGEPITNSSAPPENQAGPL